jgi:probable rRNA maturation factor
MEKLVYLPDSESWPYIFSKRSLEIICRDFGFVLENLRFNLVSDEELLQINRDHLNHDYYTDIITFPYTRKHKLMGEIFVSRDRIADNAVENNVSLKEEMARVMVHGVLHLCGLQDHTAEEKKEMRRQENKYLKKLFHGEHSPEGLNEA